MYYLLYKTVNLESGKYYIGKHATSDLDDGYIGSGTILQQAISKYGKGSFVRNDLCLLDDIVSLNDAEYKLIEQHIDDPMCYNIAPGGQGGNLIANFSKEDKQIVFDKISKSHKMNGVKPPVYDGTGTIVSEETKHKISETKSGIKQTLAHRANISKAMKGKKKNYSPNLGKVWIHNLHYCTSIMIPEIELDEYVSSGWIKGRKIKFNSG